MITIDQIRKPYSSKCFANLNIIILLFSCIFNCNATLLETGMMTSSPTANTLLSRSARQSLSQALDEYSSQQQHEEEGSRSSHQRKLDESVYHGTTTCAFVFDEGILVAVDSRASMGSYIGSGATEKVIPVSQHILATMAGGAADCSFWLRYLSMQVRLYEVENDGALMTVRRASKTLSNNLSRYLNRLSMGTMVLGYDDQEGFSIYYIDHEGVRTKGRLFAVGSGSTYAYSILDAGYRPDLSVAEATELGLEAIRHATYRDAFSGGFINIYLVRSSGWERLARVDSGYLELGHHRRSSNSPPPVVAAATASKQ